MPSTGPSARKSLRVWLVLILVLAGVSVVGATAPLSSRASTAGASTPCSDDGSGGCLVTLPCPVGQTTDCPSVDVTPNTNLNDGEYTYITTKNFDPTGSVRVAFCSAVGSSTDPSCVSGNWDSLVIGPTTVPVSDTPANGNTTTLSYPVFLDPPGEGNLLIPAHDLVNKLGQQHGFNCDDGTDPCELVVTEEPGRGADAGAGPTITAGNSAVIPVGYAAQAQGCPSQDPEVQVANSFSVEHFIPAAIEATCGQANGVVAVNTSTDDASVLNSYISGGATVALVDNATDLDQEAALLGKAYAYIPIALSGTTDSFLAGESIMGLNFPINSYKLTPNMVAGLLTSGYQEPAGSGSVEGTPRKPIFPGADNLTTALEAASPPVTCAVIQGCPSTKSRAKQNEFNTTNSTFNLLNSAPAGVIVPSNFGSFNSNVASGSSYEATSWLCNAPNAPFDVPVNENGQTSPVMVKVTDPNQAAATLTSPPGSSIWPPYPGATWVFPNCQGYLTFPALSATASDFSEAQNPSFQAKAMRGWCYGGGVLPVPQDAQDPCIAFGLMDTSEAQFYGLSTASMENASGNFVAPTVASLEAAADDLTPCPADNLSCPAGTYPMNFANTDPAAYPMPNITYAIVPTSPQTYEQGTAIKNLLTNLVNYSHGSTLPAGYAPLPTSIYQAALTDISNDLTIAPAPTTTTTTSTTTTTTTTTPATSPSSGSDSSSGSGSAYTSSGGGTVAVSSPLSSQLPLTGSTSPGGSGTATGGTVRTPVVAPPSTIPTGFLLVGLSATTRFLLPAIVVLALGSLLAGLLLLFGPGAATRRRRHDVEGAP